MAFASSDGTSRRPLGIRFLQHLSKRKVSYEFYQASVLILTFLAYTLYHLSRKPSSIVKNTFVSAVWHPHLKPISQSVTQLGIHRVAQLGVDQAHSSQLAMTRVTQLGMDQANSTQLSMDHKGSSLSTIKGWAPFDGDSGASLLGEIDVAFLAVYAVGTFFAGHLGDRVCLRWFLTVGMIGSGLFCSLFGLAYWWNIHWLPYFFIVQMLAGLFQATGWPSVVSVVANWFGKKKRGLIMGVWNAHTSFGNICGSLIASSLLDEGWGWAFLVPGMAVMSGGVLMFLFLVVDPTIVGFPSPHTHPHLGQPQSSNYEGIVADEEAPYNEGFYEGGVLKVDTKGGSYEGAPKYAYKQGSYEEGAPKKGCYKETPNLYDKKEGFSYEEAPKLYERKGSFEEVPKFRSYKGAPKFYAKKGSHEASMYEEEQSEREGKLIEDESIAVPLLVNYEAESSTCEEVHAVGFLEALAIPGVVPFSFCLFFAKLVAYSFIYWLPFYISNTEIGGEYMSDETAGNLSTLFDVGGVVGGVLAGHMSDKLNARATTAALFTWGAIPAMAMYRAFGSTSMSLNVVLLFLSGLFVNGPYSLITTAVSADLGTHERVRGNSRALATVAAIIDGTGSLGAALGPLFTGYISQAFGWNAVFAMLTLSAFISGFLLIKQVLLELKSRSLSTPSR